MKKVGVITFSKSINYGAFLQAYSLQQILKKMNYDASLIDYENPIDRARYATIKHSNCKELISSILFFAVNIRRKRNFLNDSKILKYSSVNDNFDIAIAGSDQVWNPRLVGNKIDDKFFLAGIKANKKISYAASVAENDVIDIYSNDFVKLLNDFEWISVREEDTRKKISTLTKRKVQLVADPSLLLRREEWQEWVSDIKQDKRDYVFTYFVGGISKEESKVLARVCEKIKMNCITYSKKPLEKHVSKHCYTDGPKMFIARLRDSKLVITSSFHGIALSIALRKNFYYFLPRADRRNRVDSLLRILGLTDRIIETEADIDKINLNDIDYAGPGKKLDELRHESLDWLKKAMRETNNES